MKFQFSSDEIIELIYQIFRYISLVDNGEFWLVSCFLRTMFDNKEHCRFYSSVRINPFIVTFTIFVFWLMRRCFHLNTSYFHISYSNFSNSNFSTLTVFKPTFYDYERWNSFIHYTCVVHKQAVKLIGRTHTVTAHCCALGHWACSGSIYCVSKSQAELMTIVSMFSWFKRNAVHVRVSCVTRRHSHHTAVLCLGKQYCRATL
jgi:hypothetical protein